MWATKRICNTQRQWIKLKEGRLHGCILLKCQQFRTGVLNYSSLKTIRFKSTCSIFWGKDEQMIMDMIATVNAEGVKIASGKGPKEQCDEKQHILKEKMKHLNLSFAACGFLGIYHLGAAAAFYRHGEKLLKVVKAFAGASAGSLVATVLLTAPEKIEVLLASSFVPIYAGIKAVEYKGEKWIDGGLTNGLPILPVGRTVTISPFSGRLDICPQDKGHVDLYVKVAKQDLMLSVANLIRLNQALFPPSQKKMESLFQNGFDDAVHFLLKENWFK